MPTQPGQQHPKTVFEDAAGVKLDLVTRSVIYLPGRGSIWKGKHFDITEMCR